MIIIGLYERYFAAGRKLGNSGKDAANAIYNSLPRNLKSMPLVEALVGAHAHTLYDAIFDIELTDEQEHELFEEIENDETPALRSLASRESFRRRQTDGARTRTPSRQRPLLSEPGSPDMAPSPTRRKPKESLQTNYDGKGFNFSTLKAPSPLARLFAVPRMAASTSDGQLTSPVAEEALAGVKKLETVLEGIRDLPVSRLKDDIKDLQVSLLALAFMIFLTGL